MAKWADGVHFVLLLITRHHMHDNVIMCTRHMQYTMAPLMRSASEESGQQAASRQQLTAGREQQAVLRFHVLYFHSLC